VHRRGHQPHHQQVLESYYTDFLAIHPPMFIEASDLLKKDNWLRITESKAPALYQVPKDFVRDPVASWAY
jgi:hypothetical protein